MKLLEMKGIRKSFYGVEVLHSVDFSVEKGSVHALLGENGAGKSTLMNILAGVYTKDGGTVLFDGKDYPEMTVRLAEMAGIAFVHQELNIFNTLKVYENIFIGDELIDKFGRLKIHEMIGKTNALFKDLGIRLSATEEVSELSTAEKQLIEISRALRKHAKLIILDEPTTALSNEEIDNLFGIIRRLQKEGETFIFISHKMPEIFKIADSYTVFRNGSLISSGLIKDVVPDELTKEIVGKALATSKIYEPRPLGKVVLSVRHLKGNLIDDVSLDVKKGEVIGLTGLEGAGSSELLQMIFGAMPAESGEVYVEGKMLPLGSIRSAMKSSIGMIPANRKENSIIPDMSLLENSYIAEHQISTLKHPIIKRRKENLKFKSYQKDLSIKCTSSEDLIVSLSGGNQQKVILARWLGTNADILLLDNPTQGIDVGAKDEIYHLIERLAQQGKTILFNTLEVSEIKKVADRCCVFYRGHIEADIPNAEITEERVMTYATNAHKVEMAK
ncbi:MAG: sugar ABC transporter ATP-binding protein [Bacilli bacterium]|jgi:ribose transport system ATP-binding protein|nr:sugar ABC transporter ATP-binding protein [Bacilli bacterium]